MEEDSNIHGAYGSRGSFGRCAAHEDLTRLQPGEYPCTLFRFALRTRNGTWNRGLPMVGVFDSGASRTAVPGPRIGVQEDGNGQPLFLPGSVARSCHYETCPFECPGGTAQGIVLPARIQIGDVEVLQDEFPLVVCTHSSLDYAIIGRDVINRYTALFCPAKNKVKLSRRLRVGLLGKLF